MGLINYFLKKNQTREATNLDIVFLIIGIYYGFYEKYGYTQKIEPVVMYEFFLDSVKESKLKINNIPNEQILSINNFMIEIALDSGDFPIALKQFQKLPVDHNSEEWKLSFYSLIKIMENKGFIFC